MTNSIRIVGVLVAFLAGCPSTEGNVLATDSVCMPAESRSCDCPDASESTQSCLPDGSGFEACACTCVPECGSRACGPDPICGMPCGSCASDVMCDASGSCTNEPFRITGRTRPRANVELAIGDNVSIVAADETGRYSVEVADPTRDLVVVLTARGGTANEQHIELVSVPGPLSSLIASAGPDRVVNETEHNGTWIDSLSTVRAGGLVGRNGQLPASYSEFRTAELFLNDRLRPTAMLDGALLLRRIVEGNAPALSMGFATTWALARDLGALGDLVRTVQSDPTELETLTAERETLLTDSGRFSGFAPEGIYYLGLRLRRGEHIGGGGGRIEFEANGVGAIVNEPSRVVTPAVATAWMTTTDGVEVTSLRRASRTFSLTTDEIVSLVDPGQEAEVRAALGDAGLDVEGTLRSFTYRRIGEGLSIDWLILTPTWDLALNLALAPLGVFTQPVTQIGPSEGVTWHKQEHLPRRMLRNDEIAGRWALPILGPSPYDFTFSGQVKGDLIARHELVDLAPDGTGRVDDTAGTTSTNLTWQLDANGVLELSFEDGTKQLVRSLVRTRGERGMLHSFEGSSSLSLYARTRRVDTNFTFDESTLTTPEGFYWQEVLRTRLYDTQGSGRILPDEIAGYIFRPDGSVSQVRAGEDGGPTASDSSFGWRTVDGLALLDLTLTTQGAARGRCSDPSCVVLRRRRWRPIARVDGDLHILEEYYFHRDAVGWPSSNIWNAAEQRWVTRAGGEPVDLDDITSLHEPRYTVFRLQPLE